MWRIVNTAARSGAYFVARRAGPRVETDWRRTACSFHPTNYWNNQNQPFLMAAANRVDLLVKAPVNSGATPLAISVQVRKAVNDRADGHRHAEYTAHRHGAAGRGCHRQSGPIRAASAGADTAAVPRRHQGQRGQRPRKRVVFDSHAPTTDASHPLPVPNGAPFTEHTIDGKKFDGDVGEVVLLNTVEEWTIVNKTRSRLPINHPFHIHINPFQVVEVFDPLVLNSPPATRPNPRRAVIRTADAFVAAVHQAQTSPANACSIAAGTKPVDMEAGFKTNDTGNFIW